jgi:hypothetical protein
MKDSIKSIEDFFKKKIFTLAHLYDLFLIAGNIVFAGAIGDKLSVFINGKGQPLAPGVTIFYAIAAICYIAGFFVFLKPLSHCSAVSKIPKPKFTSGDQAAMVFTSAIFGIVGAGAVITVSGVQMDPMGGGAILLMTGGFAVCAALFVFMFYFAMKIAGKGKGMNRNAYFVMLISGFLLMLPLIIGIFGPVDAIGSSFDIRTDDVRPSGIIDLLLKASMRGALVSIIAWMLVYVMRKISAAPFGVSGNAVIFLVELWITNTVVILLRFYDIRLSLFGF